MSPEVPIDRLPDVVYGDPTLHRAEQGESGQLSSFDVGPWALRRPDVSSPSLRVVVTYARRGVRHEGVAKWQQA